jgi:N-methylhydantoinase A
MIAKPELKPLPIKAGAVVDPVEYRDAYFGSRGMMKTPVYRRTDLVAGAKISGPAIVEERTSTVVLYPDQSGVVDQYLNIEISIARP